MTRFYIMRNRGYMARYLKLNGDYNPVGYALGTVLSFAKEYIRLISRSIALASSQVRKGLSRDGRSRAGFCTTRVGLPCPHLRVSGRRRPSNRGACDLRALRRTAGGGRLTAAAPLGLS